MTRAQGVDVSHWDISFEPEKASKPIDFAIMKLSEAVYPDPKITEIWEGVKKVPIRGAYHYLRSMWGWKEQADKFLELATPLDFHFYCLDFEGIGNTLDRTFALLAQSWMAYVAMQTKKRVVLYTNPSHYDADLYPYGDWMQLYPLWIAQYWKTPSPDRNPALPKKRKKGDWHIWQWASEINYPGHGHEYGCGGNSVDLNIYNGMVDEMRLWLRLDAAPPVNEKQYRVVVGHLNIRVAPNVNASIVGGMNQGQIFAVAEKIKTGEFTWLKLKDGRYVCERAEYLYVEEVS